ncbi:hypothetical protein TorRG33x02_168680 [Trema orientale]|uniref:Uncharacterized protein n=1 Tax=Trema orientale TaxID=63057 RepID=A0A2P5EPA9_TREOI|nr:hypothetical protein TorRG33x02_168680 [Trema orientale]
MIFGHEIRSATFRDMITIIGLSLNPSFFNQIRLLGIIQNSPRRLDKNTRRVELLLQAHTAARTLETLLTILNNLLVIIIIMIMITITTLDQTNLLHPRKESKLL